MSNPAFTSVVFEGNKSEVRSLYGKMKRLQERRNPLVENDYYYPNQWLGNLVSRLGADWKETYCRGAWDNLRLEANHVSFFTETVSQPPFALLKLIQQHYRSLQFYFEAEGDDWDWYLTNDDAGRYFPSRYIIDCEADMEYFNTIEEAAVHLSAFVGQPVVPTWEALCTTADNWNDCHLDTDWPINIKQIKLISNDELWD